MGQLALFGGDPIRQKPFPAYNPIGEKEKAAVIEVLDSGILSRFVASDKQGFLGGPCVNAFESAWADVFHQKHAIAMNSATSGLYAAIGAADVGPGDEVIVSPFTMVASVTAAVVFNAVPIFADINPLTYCMDVDSIRQCITARTKAIIVVHIFGQSAAMNEIIKLADEFDLMIIEDCAQAPLATHDSRLVGTFGHMAVFSLNYHKHIHTGEGGMVTTNDEALAQRLRLIRNHAEAVVGARQNPILTNMVGFNFRMGEIEAAIGLCQLQKAPSLIEQRQANVAYLESQLAGLAGIDMPQVAPSNTHVYYIHTLKFDSVLVGISRKIFVDALRAELPPHYLRESEGPLLEAGYVQPIYLEPMFLNKIAYGELGCPFTCPHYTGTTNYGHGLCPEAERAADTTITHELILPPMTHGDLDTVADAFNKVLDALPELQNYEKQEICPR